MDAHQTPRFSSDAGTIQLLAVALMAIGVVMVGSTSASLDQPLFSATMWKGTFGRQIIFSAAGLLILVASARMWAPLLLDTSSPMRRAVVTSFFVLALIGLVAVLLPGMSEAKNGSNRWLRIGPAALGLRLQPSELAKIAMILFLAWLLTRETADPRSLLRGLMPAGLAMAVCIALIGKENLGTAALLSVAGMAILVAAGCRLRYLLLIGVVGAAGLLFLLQAEDYRMDRIKFFITPEADAQGKGYQPIQSMTTIAAGGWFGSGLGTGIRKYYLPENSTDFIYSVICEETGLLGAFLVIGIYLALVWVGMRTMLAAATRFERLVAFGITMVCGTQAAMNLAVVTVSIPTTGVPLPLISAGGSGTLIWCATLGLLAAIAQRGGRAEEASAIAVDDAAGVAYA
jgi:cell division protein FtsW